MAKEIINPLPLGTLLHGKAYNYVIEAALGQGSFGITYVARVQMQGALGMLESNMKVAVKEFFMKEVNGREGGLVTASSTNGIYVDYKKKFRAEAEHLARLKHPHIINVLELFEANNTCYYVMEYIDGGSLNDYIRSRGPLPEHDVCENIRQIGDALSYMHSHKMLHLDLKPANIMRRKDGTLMLIDFGLSKQFDKDGVPESSTTIGGGTPGYAPLEQSTYSRGDGFPVAMDVYALGATAYAMATGKNPPQASSILNQGFPRKAFAQLSVSQTMVSVIEKAMAPTVANRYPTVDSMLASLNDGGNAVAPPKPVIEEPDTTPKDKKEEKQEPEDTLPQDAIGHRQKPVPAKPCVVETPRSNPPRQEKRDYSDTIPQERNVNSKKPVPAQDNNGLAKKLKKALLNILGRKEASRTKGYENGHEWVDLGLPSGTKWATMNVGANFPGDYGHYYAWGETRPKARYDWRSCFDCLDKSGNSWGIYKIGGRTRIFPTSGHDAARENWGGIWRMPTDAELEELCKKCKWTWTIQNAHRGYTVMGPNGNSIFLPAAGWRYGLDSDNVNEMGSFWSGTLSTSLSRIARVLYFDGKDYNTDFGSRGFGHSVRPVLRSKR